MNDDLDTALIKIITKCSITNNSFTTQPFNEFLNFCQDYYDQPVTTISELKSKRCNKFKGDLFELFCYKYLKFVLKYDQVWLLKEVPDEVLQSLNLKRNDMGIDLIVYSSNSNGNSGSSGYSAVQCKFRSKPKNKVSFGVPWKELSTFYALVNRTGPYVKHIVITTANYVRHVGSKGIKDLSICSGTLNKLTCNDLRLMSNLGDGNVLSSSTSISSSSNITNNITSIQPVNIQPANVIQGVLVMPNIPTPKIIIINSVKEKTEIELLREKRLTHFEKLSI